VQASSVYAPSAHLLDGELDMEDYSSAYTNGGVQPDSDLADSEYEVEEPQFESYEGSLATEETLPTFYLDYGYGGGSRKLLTLPTEIVNCTTKNSTTNVTSTKQVAFQNCTGNVTLLNATRIVLPTDLVNCTTANITTNGTQTTTVLQSAIVQLRNCSGNYTVLPLGSSSSSTGVAPPTGVWSCTPFGACGFYAGSSTCYQYRNCTCSGGVCDNANQPSTVGTCGCQFTYANQYGFYSPCSVTCGPGTQTRSASCFRSDGAVAAANQCAAPVNMSISCSYGNCLSWRAGGWGSCIGTCGTGYQQQTVDCFDTTLNEVHAGSCPNAQPPTQQPCPLQHCYSWQINGWATCPLTCGLAQQTRTIQCRDDTANTNAASGFCGAPPPTIQTCASPSTIPHCFEWRTDVWSGCSQPVCGNGIQTRNVTCYDLTADTLTSNSNCAAGSKPPTQQACIVAHCYAWQPGSFGSCSVTCGNGIQTRTNNCQDLTFAIAASDPTLCGTPPTSTQVCQSPTPPHCYAWQTAPWSAVSVPCGPGFQTRDVYCYDLTGGATVVDSFCSGAGAKPVTQQNAQIAPCYSWTIAAWSSCSTTCGAGTQTRSVICSDVSTTPGTPITVGDSQCIPSVPKPVTQQACQVAFCYAWVPTVYGPCSVPCSFGTWTRTFTCKEVQSQDDNPSYYCSGVTPTTIAPCITQQCTDSSLVALTPSVSSLSPAFAPGTTSYTLSVASVVSSVTLTGVVNQPDATIQYTPAQGSVTGLAYGTPQVVTIRVLAQNTGIQTNYVVTVSRQPSNDARLATFTTDSPNAVLSPAFVSTLQSYAMFVPDAVSTFTPSFTTVHPSATTAYSFVPALPLTPNGGITTLNVTGRAQDTTTTFVYTVQVTRGRSSVAYLTNDAFGLVPSISTLSPTFNQGLFFYTLAANVIAATTQMNIRMRPQDATSTVSIKVNNANDVVMTTDTDFPVALDVGDNLIAVKVLAGNRADYNVYQLLVHRLSSDNTLAALDTSASPTSTISPSFLPGTTSYTLRVSAAVSTINIYATFSYTKVQASSPFQYTSTSGTTTTGGACGGPCQMGTGSLPALPLLSGDNVIQMTIKPEDNSTPKVYNLTIHRSSSLAAAASIGFSGGLTLSPTFATGTTSYTMTVPSGTSSTTVTVTPSYSLAFCQYTFNQVQGTYVSLANGIASASFALPYGDLEIDVNCISEDGLASQLYAIRAHRLAIDSQMKSLTVSSSAITPTFASATLNYNTITTDATVSAQVITNNIYATFEYTFNGGANTPVAPGATTISGLLPNIGANTLSIRVTSEDTGSATIYNLSAHTP
jgi:hypothetical protein